jgi:hypothetical protein
MAPSPISITCCPPSCGENTSSVEWKYGTQRRSDTHRWDPRPWRPHVVTLEPIAWTNQLRILLLRHRPYFSVSDCIAYRHGLFEWTPQHAWRVWNLPQEERQTTFYNQDWGTVRIVRLVLLQDLDKLTESYCDPISPPFRCLSICYARPVLGPGF